MVPFVSGVLVLKTLPPVLVAYHWIVVPVAVKFATVPLLQKLCEALPVGAAGALMVAVTAKRVADSQPLTVCDA
jgi:cytochrome c oxidase assembly protein Cox11